MIKIKQQFQFFKESFPPARISIFFGFAVLLIVSIVFLKEKEPRPSKISSLFAEYEPFKSSICTKDNLNEIQCVDEFFLIKYEPFKSSVCIKDNLNGIKCVDEFFKIYELYTEIDKYIKKGINKHIKAAESLINQSPSESVVNDDSEIDSGSGDNVVSKGHLEPLKVGLLLFEYNLFKGLCAGNNLSEIKCADKFFKIYELETEFKQMEIKLGRN